MPLYNFQPMVYGSYTIACGQSGGIKLQLITLIFGAIIVQEIIHLDHNIIMLKLQHALL